MNDPDLAQLRARLDQPAASRNIDPVPNLRQPSNDAPVDPYSVLPDLDEVHEAAQRWAAGRDRDAATNAIDLLDGVANRLLLLRARLGEEIWHHERDQMYAADRSRR